MTGVTLTIDIDDIEAQAALDQIDANAADLTPLLDEIGSYLEFATRERFETGTAPDGSKWKPAARDGQTLVNSGRLLGSINYQVGKDEVQIGTNVLYGGIHQRGGEIVPKSGGKLTFRIGGRWISTKKVTMPARPYLGVSAADEKEIGIIATEWLLKGVAGSGATP